jgi:ATP-dependent Lhr-like helicase
VAAWFADCFGTPTQAQARAWPAIARGEHVLVAAPTGSGKTLAAFLAAIDRLVRKGLDGTSRDATEIVYVSPLKALSNDIEKNLVAPLAGIRASLRARNLPDIEIRTMVRTGDTPQPARVQMYRRPPHILVTTPESLYILLGSRSGRSMLATAGTIIIDEIHALAPTKRGAHLALSLERLSALCDDRLLRIGLSATQEPVEEIAHFLVGAGSATTPRAACTIIDMGHRRARDLAIELPPAPLEAVMSSEVRDQLYDKLAVLIEAHRTTLIFVNTRRMAERVARALSDRLGCDRVTAHHGSLAKEQRLDAEVRLKEGKLAALVATASLELGIDIGDVDLVCQLGSPRAIATLLQRVGRSGHAIDGVPKGRLFPFSRDDLVECVALLDSVRRGELDQLATPHQPLDVLAQQIVAEAAAREWQDHELYAMVRRAWSYRTLDRGDFSSVVRMLAEGFSTRRGRRGALVHHDAVNQVLRGRRGARLTALTSGGAIPETADYRVVLEPEDQFIGTVHEDFAVESLAGDVFQLGNRSYRISRVARGTVRVTDAAGLPPTIPFWLGEAPGRTDELSAGVSRLRDEIAVRLRRDGDAGGILRWLREEVGLDQAPAAELVDYLAAGHAALGCLPTRDVLVLERFFDESGGMQLVIHSPWGSRINRAFGLALRKRFCRKFNFELQAAATDDNILLSLTAAHSFELSEVATYLDAASVRTVLVQAVLDAPMFLTRWRWVAGIALALPRFRGGRKVPAPLARMDAEDLIAAIFPDHVACAENLVGAREIPDHPLVRQTITDCLTDAMDIVGLERLLSRLESGAIRVVARDLTTPSPLALEVLAARPYAFLDDAPLEERRAQAVLARRWLAPETAAELGRLDAAAIARVREEAWPVAETADEVHDALVSLAFLGADDLAREPGWSASLERLATERRATRVPTPTRIVWVAAERLAWFAVLWPDARIAPAITAPDGLGGTLSPEAALVEILRGRLESLGPVTVAALASPLGLEVARIRAALVALEIEGSVLRGNFTPDSREEEWCDRRLLARIHRYTVARLRAEIAPVSAREFLCFLLDWQRVTPRTRMDGPEAVASIVAQLEGFEAPAGAWEAEILPARIGDYAPARLDAQCLAGRVGWARLTPRGERASDAARPRQKAPLRTTPIALFIRRHAPAWASLTPAPDGPPVGPRAERIAEHLREHGASFFDEIGEATGLLRSEAEEALAELVAAGSATSDSFAGLRALLVPSAERPGGRGARRRHASPFGMETAGRWALSRKARSSAPGPADSAGMEHFPANRIPARASLAMFRNSDIDAKMRQNSNAERLSDRDGSESALEHVARTLLGRWGVVSMRILERESSRLPPWRDLLRVYRKLEARGDIRGGRFVAGLAGEQFALPEAIGLLREIRRRVPTGELVALSAADPLNLLGILLPGPRLPAVTTNRMLLRDGLPVALLVAGEVRLLETCEPAVAWEMRKLLLRCPASLPARMLRRTEEAADAPPTPEPLPMGRAARASLRGRR